MNLIDLPDDLLHAILRYTTKSPTLIGHSICHLRLLSKQWQLELDEGRKDLWELALHDLSYDYRRWNCRVQSYGRGGKGGKGGKGASNKRRRTDQRDQPLTNPTNQPDRPERQEPTAQNDSTPRRSSRLRPTTPQQKFIHSYNLLLYRTESAHSELTDLTYHPTKSLTTSKLHALLHHHAPVAINQRVRTGGTFLVEVCRARFVTERTILNCVRVLVEEYGADVNLASLEGGATTTTARSTRTAATPLTTSTTATATTAPSTASTAPTTSNASRQKVLYPLIIAAARGMPTVVNYLLTLPTLPNTKTNNTNTTNTNNIHTNNANNNNANNINNILTYSKIDLTVRGSSQFRLFCNRHKSVKGANLTALEFALKMREEERRHGATEGDLKGLKRVISLLEKKSTRIDESR